ncbi:MAG: hypothetical protein NC925_01780 [Candidatus Omnitrophica bacterium]|nr:hypothetical protein [Candidatus Omnitrophota bacterium]
MKYFELFFTTLKLYLKDLIIFIFLIIVAIVFYDKPIIKTLPNKSLAVEKKVTIEELEKKDGNRRKDIYYKNINATAILKLFQDTGEKGEQKVHIEKPPSLKEYLFNETLGSIKVLAIFGSPNQKRALIVDHMNNIKILREGERIEKDVVVLNISESSIKFKSGNRIKELMLFQKEKPKLVIKDKFGEEPSSLTSIEEMGEMDSLEREELKKRGLPRGPFRGKP